MQNKEKSKPFRLICIGCVRTVLIETPLQTRGLEIAGSAGCVCRSGRQQGREGTPALKLDRSCSLLCFYKRRQRSPAGREINAREGRAGETDKGRRRLVFLLLMDRYGCVCVCVWADGRTCTCTAERWGTWSRTDEMLQG